MVYTDKKLFQCVGLWLAEGDRKSDYEITFTNNCWQLINLFHLALKKRYKLKNKEVRIYVYSKKGSKLKIPLSGVRTKFYTDRRATKPYYIWRLGSRKTLEVWKELVAGICSRRKNYEGILQGFFAGEGHVKSTSNKSRSVIMSQAKPLDVIDKALGYLKFIILLILTIEEVMLFGEEKIGIF